MDPHAACASMNTDLHFSVKKNLYITTCIIQNIDYQGTLTLSKTCSMSRTPHTCRYKEGKEEGRERGEKGGRRERGREEGVLGMSVYTHVCTCKCMCVLGISIMNKYYV